MPPILPGNIAIHYSPETGNEIRAESYGVLHSARINADPEWRKQRGTFDDRATFGPKRDFECACGKYFGRQHAGIICDQCGVKITTSDARRTRCAHINLPVPVSHPLAAVEPVNSLPVLPVAFIEAPSAPSCFTLTNPYCAPLTQPA
jgi:DNA-directed RNA polymerase beta' subunit